jgi:RimJ/RimL family protein N-acetyltransferase
LRRDVTTRPTASRSHCC